ncbi:helix-turn-helix domain-containing protein [Streptomyces sp. OUCMDZ-4982]|uniref:helix-turn-helix domain-containing protein n=1 Tax=Streptomyces sp. OUCMDZ-4982 TaxID=2973090 RepID=UPI00215CA4A4|nr:helix-turn-helix transcriptional regulator [Streptomyces sp. OUCMDZ-4982]MCR8945555.1 helix-turn-helix domain-containing protein [Streptomyces sp. OUCMDZ-4982]
MIAALTYWPDVIRGGREYPPEPVDLTVLPPFLNGLLADLPWWNHDWRVGHVEPGVPLEIGSDHRGHPAGFTEVSVPGTVGPGDGESLPFVAKVGFAGDQLIRFQAKIADVVIGPAVAPAGRPEPHPFGRLFTGLMDLRGIPVKRMAWQTERSRSTIWMLRDGMYNPDPPLVREIAEALGLSEADVRVIAGLDTAGPREEAP